MENGKPKVVQDIPPQMNQNLQQAGEYLRGLQSRFSSSVLAPGKQRSQEFAREYPVTATFLFIFAVSAFIPLVAFLTFVTFIFFSSTLLALSLAVGFTLFVGFWAGVFLFFTLALMLFFAGATTLCLLGGFLAYRLVFHVRSEEGQGVRGWATETKQRLAPPGIQQYTHRAQKPSTDINSHKSWSPKLEQL
ncbi:hypothetical protein CPB86DRAFT_783592 [Serendipita vermifera]|nr:hypothetical protein CPB86DRAFT_783592 [Serendipita vermifera]